MLQVDLGTDKRTCTDRAVQWEQRSHEFKTRSRGTLLNDVNDAIFTERSPTGKDTENDKGERVEGYCGHCGNGGSDKRFVCWSRQVYKAETDTAELQDVDPTSKQTPVPVAAPRRISNTGLPEEQRNDGRIRTIPSQSA